MTASFIIGALTRQSLSASSQVDSSSSCRPGYTHKTSNSLCKVISAHCLKTQIRLVKILLPYKTEVSLSSFTHPLDVLLGMPKKFHWNKPIETTTTTTTSFIYTMWVKMKACLQVGSCFQLRQTTCNSTIPQKRGPT